MTKIDGKEVLKKLNGGGEVATINKKPTTLKEWFADPEFKSKIITALPKVINSEAFITNAYNIYVSNKKLQECTISSFLTALMDAAKVGQMPNSPLGRCFIVPYRVKGVMTAKFQMGYPGHIDLAYRTNQYKGIYAHAVYPEDEFDYCYGYDKHLTHIPCVDGHGKSKPIFWYGVYRLKNGGGDFVVWPRERMMAHKNEYSESYKAAKKYGKTSEANWETDEEFMGIKTMVIQVLKLGPKSTEMVYALSTEPGGEGLKGRFKEEGPLNGMVDVTVEEAEFVKEKVETTDAKEEQVKVDKTTGEVTNDITEKEKEEIDKVVSAKEERTLFKDKRSVSKGEDFINKEDKGTAESGR